MILQTKDYHQAFSRLSVMERLSVLFCTLMDQKLSKLIINLYYVRMGANHNIRSLRLVRRVIQISIAIRSSLDDDPDRSLEFDLNKVISILFLLHLSIRFVVRLIR
jgi:hypothetical protein